MARPSDIGAQGSPVRHMFAYWMREMFISDRIVFLELHKTGCTHIRDLLSTLLEGDLVGKHNQAEESLFDGRRAFWGSVRDPWEWYCSLWAYGCDSKGSVYGSVLREGRKIRGLGWRSNPFRATLMLLSQTDPERWRATYEDVNDPENFRAWMRLVHSPKTCHAVGDGYPKFGATGDCGLMTFRYLKLFCTKAGHSARLSALRTYEDVAAYEAKFGFIDHFIRNDLLEEDLFAGLDDLGIPIPEETIAWMRSKPRTNTSSRSRSLAYYYDAETERLVLEREKLIVKKFAYMPPSERSVAA